MAVGEDIATELILAIGAEEEAEMVPASAEPQYVWAKIKAAVGSMSVVGRPARLVGVTLNILSSASLGDRRGDGGDEGLRAADTFLVVGSTT